MAERSPKGEYPEKDLEKVLESTVDGLSQLSVMATDLGECGDRSGRSDSGGIIGGGVRLPSGGVNEWVGGGERQAAGATSITLIHQEPTPA